MIKKRVVEEDPTEQGERALLNFGHTLGHAVEKLENFTMHHGHCVGLGCIAAARISQLRGMLTAEEAADIREQVLKTTQSDKKVDAGVIRFVLLNSIGQAYVDKTVTADEMKAGFDVIGGQA